MSRFSGDPEYLVDQAHHYLPPETFKMIVLLMIGEEQSGVRFTPDDIRDHCETRSVAPDPVLRALGWGPRDRDMMSGSITSVGEDMAETAGTCLAYLRRSFGGKQLREVLPLEGE